MALVLYRRHRRDCKAAYPEQLHTSEFDERKKGYRRCDCPIVASGTLAGRFRRQSTGTWEWDTAKALLAALEQAGSWDAQKPKLSQPPIAAASDPRRITILEATEAYMATCKHRGLQPSSLSKYRTSMNQLTAYSDSRGYLLLDQLTVADMDRFYASWKDGKRAGAKKLARLKAFVKFCRKRKWLSDDITEDLQPQQGSSIPANKTPFTDEELNRIYAACDVLGGPKPPGPGAREWTGSDLQTFIMLSVYTGLRISDVATFNIRERLEGNDVFLRMHKTRKPLFTWIPDWLVSRLKEMEQKNGALIFRTGQSLQMQTMAELWRVKLAKAFKIAGPFEEPPLPHRFRHTFVRILLEKGVPVADVAELIGDTEEIVRRHYARWVPERQARLTKILKDAFDDKPKPKLVALPGGRG